MTSASPAGYDPKTTLAAIPLSDLRALIDLAERARADVRKRAAQTTDEGLASLLTRQLVGIEDLVRRAEMAEWDVTETSDGLDRAEARRAIDEAGRAARAAS